MSNVLMLIYKYGFGAVQRKNAMKFRRHIALHLTPSGVLGVLHPNVSALFINDEF